LAGTHAASAWHATHAPALQTMFVPQDLPSSALPTCMHTAVPLAHETRPT
jgi:hypothetical protein